jgi:hypothetical protein
MDHNKKLKHHIATIHERNDENFNNKKNKINFLTPQP